MSHLPELLARIPDQLKPMAAIGIGALILVLLVLVHGIGLHGILVFRAHRERSLRMGRPHVIGALLLFGSSVFLMLSLHIVEFVIWAYVLVHMGLIAHVYDALYFCANAYTTLGYGSVDVGQHWRNIAPIMGISGLFTFAWTTSALVGVVAAHKKLIEQLLEEREHEMHMRSSLRKAEWDSLKSERDSERTEKEMAETQAAGASFSERRGIWRDERNRVKELRRAKAAEILDIHRKERQDEEKLGSPLPPEQPGDKKSG